jgi:dipeptidyl aminopeptidase/acylaminoacyl peptidase
VRNTWAFDPEGQWFANRGYLTVQVNYRGSAGYGRAFVDAGDREWGGKMHEDILDAVDWVVAQKYADPERIGIYGGSYGGYEALVAATFSPDVFRCAVDMCGPSDLVSFIESIPPLWQSMRAIFDKRVGNVDTEREFLRSRSPITAVDQIKIPLLIAQGANDPRVTRAQSDQIVAKLEEKGIAHEYLVFEDEGHGLAKPENRYRFYDAVERFLAEHLGGRYETDQ